MNDTLFFDPQHFSLCRNSTFWRAKGEVNCNPHSTSRSNHCTGNLPGFCGKATAIGDPEALNMNGCQQAEETLSCPDRSTTISCWRDNGEGPCYSLKDAQGQDLFPGLDKLFK